MPTLFCRYQKTPITQTKTQNSFAFSNKETLTDNIISKKHDLKQLTIATCTLGALGTSFLCSKLCRKPMVQYSYSKDHKSKALDQEK